MKAIAKKGLMLLVIVSLLCGSVSTSVQASDQKSSKVTKVITLTSDMNTKKKYLTLYHHLEVDDNEEVIVNVKFLQVKGKVSLTSRDKELYSDWKKGLTWGGCLYKDVQDPLFSPRRTEKYGKSSVNKITKNSFKKGNAITAYAGSGLTAVNWSLPTGLKKIKMKVTYYTKSGRAGIRFKRVQKVRDYWY